MNIAEKCPDYSDEVAAIEAPMRAIREAIRNTPLWESSKFEDSQQRSPNALVYLQGEGGAPSVEFHRGSYPSQEKSDSHYGRVRAPCSWVRWSTEDRALFVTHIPRIIEGLRGIPVQVNYDSSWRWEAEQDDERRTERYIPVYQLFLIVDRKNQFAPQSGKDWLSRVCHSTDKRADRRIFDLLEEAGADVVDASYQWTRTGFHFSAAKKGLADAVEQVFADCKISRTRENAAEHTFYNLVVDFPGELIC